MTLDSNMEKLLKKRGKILCTPFTQIGEREEREKEMLNLLEDEDTRHLE